MNGDIDGQHLRGVTGQVYELGSIETNCTAGGNAPTATEEGGHVVGFGQMSKLNVAVLTSIASFAATVVVVVKGV